MIVEAFDFFAIHLDAQYCDEYDN